MSESLNINICKRYTVTLSRDCGSLAKGSAVELNMIMASAFLKEGKISEIPEQMKDDAVKSGVFETLFGLTKKAEKLRRKKQ